MRLYLFASFTGTCLLGNGRGTPLLEVQYLVFPSLRPDFSAPENAEVLNHKSQNTCESEQCHQKETSTSGQVGFSVLWVGGRVRILIKLLYIV